MNAEQALQELVRGNRRYIREHYAGAHIGPEQRRKLTQGQFPFAIILSCSDSRVPPEIVFDQGLGDLFVVRTAGQALDSIALGSIEYAVEYLKVKLLVVLGHEDCGAVKAALADELPPGRIADITAAIRPAVELTKVQSGNSAFHAVVNNVGLGVEALSDTPLLRKASLAGGLRIVGAVYCLQNGQVVFLQDSGRIAQPGQNEPAR